MTDRPADAGSSLEERARYLDALFLHALTPLVLLDRDFNFIRVNEAYAKACGREVGDFPGHNHFEFYPSDARTIFEDVRRSERTDHRGGASLRVPRSPGVGDHLLGLEPLPGAGRVGRGGGVGVLAPGRDRARAPGSRAPLDRLAAGSDAPAQAGTAGDARRVARGGGALHRYRASSNLPPTIWASPARRPRSSRWSPPSSPGRCRG